MEKQETEIVKLDKRLESVFISNSEIFMDEFNIESFKKDFPKLWSVIRNSLLTSYTLGAHLKEQKYK